jgi:hypothetical protein
VSLATAMMIPQGSQRTATPRSGPPFEQGGLALVLAQDHLIK